MQLASQTYGSSGAPIIVLHGLFGSRENWHSMCLRLAHRFRVFSLDQRNHGASPHASPMDYPTMAEDVREFIAGQALGPAHLLGHSMGAKTAMQLALIHPELVRSITSVDMAPREYTPRHQKIIDGLLSLNLEAASSRHELEQALAAFVPDLATRRFLLKNARHSPRGFHWRMGLRQIAQNYPHLRAAVAGSPFSGPALFLRGEQSDYLLESDTASIRRLFPKAEMRTVPQAGHLVHMDNPDAFLNEVLDFVQRLQLL